MKRLLHAMLLAGTVPANGPAALAADRTQYVPLPTYRVGAYASSGELRRAGERDYFRNMNEVEGGIEGVKADHALIRPLIQDGAAAYARQNGITPRTAETN